MDFKQQLKVAYNKDAQRRDSAEGKRDQWKLDIRQLVYVQKHHPHELPLF